MGVKVRCTILLHILDGRCSKVQDVEPKTLHMQQYIRTKHTVLVKRWLTTDGKRLCMVVTEFCIVHSLLSLSNLTILQLTSVSVPVGFKGT